MKAPSKKTRHRNRNAHRVYREEKKLEDVFIACSGVYRVLGRFIRVWMDTIGILNSNIDCSIRQHFIRWEFTFQGNDYRKRCSHKTPQGTVILAVADISPPTEAIPAPRAGPAEPIGISPKNNIP